MTNIRNDTHDVIKYTEVQSDKSTVIHIQTFNSHSYQYKHYSEDMRTKMASIHLFTWYHLSSSDRNTDKRND
jgi:hypothetical protein